MSKSLNITQGTHYSNMGNRIVKAKLTSSSPGLNINISNYNNFIYNILLSDNRLISLYDLQEYNRSNSSSLNLFIEFRNTDTQVCSQPSSYFNRDCLYTYSKNNNKIKIENNNNKYLEFEIIN